MTTDTLNEIEELLPQLSSAMDANRLDDAARRALENLKDATRQAKRFEAFVGAIQALGLSDDVALRSALYAAAHQAEEVGEALEAATDSSGVQDAAADFLRLLVPAVGRLENAVTDSWRTIVRDQFEPLAGTGALLEIIPAAKTLGAELKATALQARSLAEHRVAAEQFAATVTRLMRELPSLKSRVQAVSGGQREVDTFVNAVNQNKATLRHMTPAVIKWLIDNDALDRFAVRAAN